MQEMLLKCTSRFVRMATHEDGRLTDFCMEKQTEKKVQVGSIVMAKVVDVVPGMQSAFVDIGLEKNGFLHISDLMPHDASVKPEELPTIDALVEPGQELMVQVKKEPNAQKGARVTTHFSLPGRYVVYLPFGGYVGISRKVEEDAERGRLKVLATTLLKKPEGMIVRTVSEGASQEEVQKDLDFLRRVWRGILTRAEEAHAPELLYLDIDVISRLVRDWWHEGMDRIVVDREQEYRQLRHLMSRMKPSRVKDVMLYQGRDDLFKNYKLDHEIESLHKERVWLKNGSYIVINDTEALTSIDVNTGKYVGTHDLADTVLSTNKEAAVEIARQIRLRDIGGIIVIDFIDMQDPAHKEEVMAVFQAAMKPDRSRLFILGFTPLGLFEVTRKKSRQTPDELLFSPCHHCQGRGREPSLDWIADQVEQSLRKEVHGVREEAVLIELNPALAAVFIGSGGCQLKNLEETLNKKVIFKGNSELPVDQYRLVCAGKQEQLLLRALPVQVGEELDVKIEDSHVHFPQDGIARKDGYVIQVEHAGEQVGEVVKVKVIEINKTYAKAVPVDA